MAHGSATVRVQLLGHVAETSARADGGDMGVVVHGKVLEPFEVDDYCAIASPKTCSRTSEGKHIIIMISQYGMVCFS